LVEKDFETFNKIFPINLDTITFIVPRTGGKLAHQAQYQHEDESIKAFKKNQFKRAQRIFVKNPFL
jgi:hypothetical protein